MLCLEEPMDCSRIMTKFLTGEMKMKRLILLLPIFIFFSVNSIAAGEVRPLSKSLIESFLVASKDIGILGQKHPELANYTGGFNSENKSEVIKFLKASSAYPEIKKIIKASVFTNLEELFVFSERILAIGYYSRVNNSDNVSLFQTEKILQANLNNLRVSNASETIISKAEKTLDYIRAQLKIVQQKLASISDEDKAFVIKNNAWLKQKFAAKQ